MKIGILKCGRTPAGLRAAHGDYDDMFASLLADRSSQFDSYHVERMIFPRDVHAAEAWIVTGSPHGVYEDHAFLAPLEQFIQGCFAARVPVIGICFGHQIIAQAMGGVVERFDGGWSIGPTAYDFGGKGMTMNAWHRDQVTRLPAGATRIATSPRCKNAALRYGDLALTMQPHPEFTTDFVLAKLDTSPAGLIPPAIAREAKAKAETPVDGDFGATMLRDFLHGERGTGAAL